MKLHPTPLKTSHARRVLLAGIAAAAVLAAAGPVLAQDYPNKVIKLVVPYPPGGATDVIGRVMAQKLSVALGQQVIVDNRAGAAGSIGAAAVASAAPDGYTLLMGAMTSHSISAVLYKKTVNFDMEKSFAPVAIVGSVPLVFVVNPSIKANTLPEFIALAKSKPGKLSFASAGNGSPQHLAGEMFQRVAGVEMLHVPYKGSGPAMTDLMGGQVDSMIETAPAAQAHVKAGKLRAIASATSKRLAGMPELPTAAEQGLPGFESSVWFGILAPRGLPEPIAKTLETAILQATASPDVVAQFRTQSIDVIQRGQADFTAYVKAENEKWTKVIKVRGLKLD